MAQNQDSYWIHSLGLSHDILPNGAFGNDMFGHGDHSWDMESYTFQKITDYYIETIPKNANVIGHGLGGHIAINVALKRKDITLTVLGMVPANSRDEAFFALKSNELFQKFFLSKRTYQDLVHYSSLLTKNLADQSRFINSMLKQDPLFNETLFTTGYENYDWCEKDKVNELGKDRFKLIVNDKDPLVDYDSVQMLNINIEKISRFGHCPWRPKDQLSEQKSLPFEGFQITL